VGILLQIARVIELGGVDEDTADGALAFCQGAAQQGEVALVQRSHSRHKTDAAVFIPLWL